MASNQSENYYMMQVTLRSAGWAPAAQGIVFSALLPKNFQETFVIFRNSPNYWAKVF